MKTFHCQHCRSAVYFENTLCNHCGHVLGVLDDVLDMSALRDRGNGEWAVLAAGAPHPAYRKCQNYAVHQVCNWIVPAESGEAFCTACRLNEVIPNLDRHGHLDRWYRLERSKRRVVYSLLKLGLPLKAKREDPQAGLAFSFLSKQDAAPGQPVVTGHADGRITINVDEADPSIRERNRLDLDEKYRTLLGHFRHEVGHYYWDRLVRDGGRLRDFRVRFGDERSGYAEALRRHYAEGPPGDWQSHFITPYASAHPWEDWAETWAHYLHIVDTLETAGHFGLEVQRELPDGSVHRADPDFDAYRLADFEPIIEHWIPLTFALNSLNRSMGLQDLYPFVISAEAQQKLRFVHQVVRACGAPPPAAARLYGSRWSRFTTLVFGRMARRKA